MFSALRLIHLDADPPTNMGGSAGYFVDEGGWVYNARNKVLFGTWELDNYNKMYLAPVMNFLYYLSFMLFGTGYIQARIVSVILSFLIFFTLFFTIKGSFSKSTAFLTVLLLTFNYLFIVFSRITHPRMGMMFFMALSFLFFHKGFKHNFWYFIPLGSSLFLGFICQANMLYFIAAMVLAIFIILLKDYRENFFPVALKTGLFLAIGMGIIFLPWYFLNCKPNTDSISLFSSIIRQRQIPGTLPELLRNILKEPSRRFFYHFMPFIWIGAWISILVITIRAFISFKHLSHTEIFSLLWAIAGIAFLAIMNDPALRWYISIVPPLIILNGLLFHTILQVRAKSIRTILISIFSVCLAFSLFLNVRNYVTWIIKPEFKIKNISTYLEENLDKAVICGLWSAELCLGNKHKSYISWRDLINYDPEFLKRVGATHIFVVEYNREDKYYREYFPSEMKEAKLLKKFNIWHTDALLYELNTGS